MTNYVHKSLQPSALWEMSINYVHVKDDGMEAYCSESIP